MNSKLRILVVDDDHALLGDVRPSLEKQGYEVLCAEDGLTALKIAKKFYPDMVILDVSFPEGKSSQSRSLDGIEILQRLREFTSVPVLMLSATNVTTVKVMALSTGADDYLTKPFETQELVARVSAILRRGPGGKPDVKVLNFERLRLDPGERRVWKDNRQVNLTGIEFDILYTLARRPQHVFTREKLIELAWKGESLCIDKAVDVHIGHIRKKLEDEPSEPAFIVTVRGTGYRFEGAPELSVHA